MSDVSESLISLTKNERMSESLIFLSESLIRSFLGKNLAIRSENRRVKSQPWINATGYLQYVSLLSAEKSMLLMYSALRHVSRLARG